MKFASGCPLAVACLLPTVIALAQPAPQTTENIIQSGGRNYGCKCYPGDRCWPNPQKWKALNDTVGGALKEVIPNWAVCYNTFEGKPTYNAAACAEATANFPLEEWTTTQDILNLWIYWTNNTCLPTTNPGDTCTLGYYPEYVIRAKTKADIKAGIDFARNNNIRLIIRNTGHDFMGRSTGYGSLAINTHDFKSVEFTKKYTGPGGYRGGAVTVGAGIQGRELLRLGYQQSPKVAVVTGECPTVGLAGGYIQGGGHGPLATIYGLAADQALSFDVITADGVYRTANARENPDLFWALKGGGPSTFATIVSLTVKTFPEVTTSGAVFRINETHTNDTEVFWKGFKIFHNLSNRYVENGMFSYYQLLANSVNAQPMVAPNKTAAELKEILKPLEEQLKAQNIPHSLTYHEYSTFFDLYIDLFTDESSGANMLVGGRLFTKTDITNNGDGIVDAMRQSIKAGGFGMIGHIVGPGTGAPVVDNAVHPRWRDGASFSISVLLQPTNTTWAEKQAAQVYLTEQVDGPLRAASPNGAAYVNEGNLEEPNWQEAYWGSNYPRLLSLKKKWDPKGVFYARTTPGTEDWEVIDYGTRLCKKM